MGKLWSPSGVSGEKSIPDEGSSKGPFPYSINKHLLELTQVRQLLKARHSEQKEMIPNSED